MHAFKTKILTFLIGRAIFHQCVIISNFIGSNSIYHTPPVWLRAIILVIYCGPLGHILLMWSLHLPCFNKVLNNLFQGPWNCTRDFIRLKKALCSYYSTLIGKLEEKLDFVATRKKSALPLCQEIISTSNSIYMPRSRAFITKRTIHSSLI